MNFEKTDLFKEAQTTAGRYGWAGARGTGHTTDRGVYNLVPRATRLQGHVTKRNDGVWGRECGVY